MGHAVGHPVTSCCSRVPQRIFKEVLGHEVSKVGDEVDSVGMVRWRLNRAMDRGAVVTVTLGTRRCGRRVPKAQK